MSSMIDNSEISNLMADTARRTFHVCVRCIFFFAGGQFRYCGKHGCCFAVAGPDNIAAFKGWLVDMESADPLQYFRCFRCAMTNSVCFALPEGYSDDLTYLQDQFGALVAADATPEARELAEGRIQSHCSKMVKKIKSEFNPQAEHLFLHSGTLVKNGEPSSGARAEGRKRDKATIEAKSLAAKRKLEADVSAWGKSPSKKGKARATVADQAKRDLIARGEALEEEITALQASKEGKNALEKGRITKLINSKKKDRDALARQAAVL